MANKTYIVDGRQFHSQAEQKNALHDKELIDRLRESSQKMDLKGLKALADKLSKGEYKFYTLLGEDFEDEIRQRIRNLEKVSGQDAKAAGASKNQGGKAGKSKSVSEKSATGKNLSGRSASPQKYTPEQEAQLEKAVREELKKRERRRKGFLILSALMAAFFLGIFGLYAYKDKMQNLNNERLGELIGKEAPQKRLPDDAAQDQGSYTVNRDAQKDPPEILDEYKAVYNQHKKLIGWLRFDDKDIGGKYGFPVMQTGDNEYFLSHNSELEEDKNGAIFLDTQCDVLKPSTNYILYGHKMQSGAMFGRLDRYEKESYCKKHPYIEFDTIYEKGLYRVMYVFRSHVYSEEDVNFKYYQFHDAYSEVEFNSYMEEMARMSLYDTGVTANYGDFLLTLSTCDYTEKDGRFVVVAKKVTARE